MRVNNQTKRLKTKFLIKGGLLARCILQSTDHNVKTFIALSSPNGGQFGATKNIQEWFPHISDRRALHKFLYSAAGQKISFGNYWKDPFQLDEYSKKSDYLAIYNGESDRVKPEENWRVNFGKLEKLVTIGGDSDEIITPWQSAHFANYAKNDDETGMFLSTFLPLRCKKKEDLRNSLVLLGVTAF